MQSKDHARLPPSPLPRLCQTRADRTLPAVANVYLQSG